MTYKRVRRARAGTAVVDAYVGPIGELVIDTDLLEIRLQNGVAGGLRVPRFGGPAVFSTLQTTGNCIFGDAAGDLVTVTGNTVVGVQSTQNVFNTVATTLNLGGGATTSLNLGSATGVVNIGAGQFIKDAVGNVALGSTPSAWGTGLGVNALQVQNSLSLWSVANGGGYIGNNEYVDSVGARRYLFTAGASELVQSGGSFDFTTAPTGTVGTVMTLTSRFRVELGGNIIPGVSDNTQNVGAPANRWAVIYAGTGTINTSDAREKTEVHALTENEIQATKQLSKEIGTYKFLSSVQAKGDEARTHIGMTVQRAIEIMQANNLNPFAYGFICYDVWEDEFKQHPEIEAVEAQDAVFDEEGNLVSPAVQAVEYRAAYSEQTKVAGDRYGFRYDQLNLFIAAGIEARLTALESA